MSSKALVLFVSFWICSSVSCRLLAQQLQVSNFALKHFTPADGLGSTQTRGIIQDSLGYIWIASSFGLSRFDGYNFKTYKFDPDNNLRSVFSGGIWHLQLDRSGQLWMTSEILSRYDSKTDDLIHYKPELDLKKVFRYCFEKQGPVVWMGTHVGGLFAFDTETKKTTNYLRNHSDSLTRTKRNSVWGISDRGSSLLLATRQGLWNFDKANGNFSRPQGDPRDSAFLYNTPIWHIIDWPRFDSDDTWLVLENGLLKVNRQLSIVHRFDYPDGFRTNSYRRDAQGIFWLMDFNNRLHRYNPFDGSFHQVEIKTGDQPFVFERDFWVDRNQTIWSGSEANGVYQLIPQSLSFYNFNFPERGQWTVSSIYRANRKEHLVLTKAVIGGDNELWTAYPILNEKTDSVEFQKLKINTSFHGFIMSTVVSGNTLWLCSWDSGITGMHINDKGVIEPDNRFTLTSDPNNPNTVSNQNNGFIYSDEQENIWIVSRGNGVSKVVSKMQYGEEGSVLRYQHVDSDSNSLSHNYGVRIYPEDEKSLWVLTWAGADLFRNGVFDHVVKNKGTPRTILKSADGSLFIGTMGGLYRGYKVGDHYNIQDTVVFKDYVIEDILEDRQRRLWFTNPLANTLVCYDPEENASVAFLQQDGLPTGVTDFSQTSKGVMVLTSIHGFTLFDPLSFQMKRSGTLPVLTSVLVNNRVPRVNPATKINDEFSLNDHISELDELVLDHRHNNFTIEFSSMEMTSPEKNLYRHKLEGFDQDWIETDAKNRTVSYTNLDAGTYYFKVKASNHYGIWNNKERMITIRILPPPWATWWAYTGYGLALIGIFLSWRRYDIKRVKLKHRAEHLSELDNLKTRFFTNISHEFRTPITLIQGPLKEMYDKAANKEERSTFGIMLRNTQRLSKLINQLLDLSKLEAGKMTLHASKVELVQFLREIASSYESLAANKNIRYFFYAETAELMTYFDVEKIEKVVHNLLSNAFKFTKEGEIALHLKTDGKQCIITVKDTGIGIPTDQLNKVFDRFYQVDSSQTRSFEGSGLGMALAKELTELHHGTIAVESIEGKGTTFTVRLPLGKVRLTKDQIIDTTDLKKSETYYEDLVIVNVNHKPEHEKVIESDQPILLIVEDNKDMRHYIRKTFADQYQIMEAGNGKDGIVKAQEVIPNLIISDVMMPEMDGYKFCEQIKSNELTSHVPVILLTAKADQQSKLTGLEIGADDYLTKPFDADELKLIVRNRIEQRKKISERFSKEITLEPKRISITSFDEKFLIKVLAIIESRMGDENLSIDELSREAGYSNMHFYRKIKALAGVTPSQFLRTIRLKRAAELLCAKSDNVTQIAYSVGFNSLSYFNKCFKEQFGVTPGQFANESSKQIDR